VASGDVEGDEILDCIDRSFRAMTVLLYDAS